MTRAELIEMIAADLANYDSVEEFKENLHTEDQTEYLNQADSVITLLEQCDLLKDYLQY